MRKTGQYLIIRKNSFGGELLVLLVKKPPMTVVEILKFVINPPQITAFILCGLFDKPTWECECIHLRSQWFRLPCA